MEPFQNYLDLTRRLLFLLHIYYKFTPKPKYYIPTHLKQSQNLIFTKSINLIPLTIVYLSFFLFFFILQMNQIFEPNSTIDDEDNKPNVKPK